MNVKPGETYTLTLAAGVTGLEGTIEVGLLDEDGTLVSAFSAAGVAEKPAGSGVYFVDLVAPTTEGFYQPIWSLDGTTDPAQVRLAEAVHVAFSASGAASPAGSDLCTLVDVKAYVPAYTGDTADDVLQALITAESDLFARDARREIAQPSGTPSTRMFTVNEIAAKGRMVPVGDLSSAAGITVTLLESDGTADDTVADLYVPLYDRQRNPTAVWEPVTEISFPRYLTDAPKIRTGKVLTVNGVWGFPSIPSFVAQGVAARVILRYLTDVAAQGTDFADAVVQSSLSFAGLSDRSEDALAAVQRRPWP